jgi:hypothetical protein
MPTLIELSPETRGDVPAEVTHLVEEPIIEGDPEPEFLFSTSGKWRRNSWRGLPLPRGTAIERFARRATPSEIAAQAPSVGRDVHQFFAAQGEWSQATFGLDSERGCIGPLKHLEKEAREAYTETDREKRHMEIVDCFFLTCDSARRDGMSFDDLLALAWKKLEINKARQWSKPTSDEPVEHVRNEGAPQ